MDTEPLSQAPTAPALAFFSFFLVIPPPNSSENLDKLRRCHQLWWQEEPHETIKPQEVWVDSGSKLQTDWGALPEAGAQALALPFISTSS